ncbi:MAG: alpha-glucosidase C-terminal domain-containing protein [Silvibacterium sp.]
MLDRDNPSVLLYVRIEAGGNPAVVVALNFTSQPRMVSLNREEAGVRGKTVKTLLTDAPSLMQTDSLRNITLPPYASWFGSVE